MQLPCFAVDHPVGWLVLVLTGRGLYDLLLPEEYEECEECECDECDECECECDECDECE